MVEVAYRNEDTSGIHVTTEEIQCHQSLFFLVIKDSDMSSIIT